MQLQSQPSLFFGRSKWFFYRIVLFFDLQTLKQSYRAMEESKANFVSDVILGAGKWFQSLLLFFRETLLW